MRDPAWRFFIPSGPRGAPEEAQEGVHLYGALGALAALVAGLGAGTLYGLLYVLRGQDTEHDGYARLELYGGYALADFGADVLIVAGAAADDGAEADHGVVAAARGHLFGDQRYLKGAGHPGDGDIVIVHTAAPEPVESAAEQAGGDELVEAGTDYAHADVAGYKLAFIGFHAFTVSFSS